MRSSLCMALFSAGLFSVQVTFAQTAAPTYQALNVDCLTKPLALTPQQVTSIKAIDQKYSMESTAVLATKPTTAVITQKLADIQRKRDTEARATLTREQSPKWDAAMLTCITKPTSPVPTEAPMKK